MNLEQKLAYVAEEVKKVEKWAEENRSSRWYDDFVGEISWKLREVRMFARENTVPFIVSAEEIADKHYDDTDGYSEEESSSYYEEESSEYDEPEEEDDEDTEESNY